MRFYPTEILINQPVISPRCPAGGPHTAVPQTPLVQHKVGCRTMWPEVPPAGRSSRIQNLHEAEQVVKYKTTEEIICNQMSLTHTHIHTDTVFKNKQ